MCVWVCVYYHVWKIQSAIPSELSKNCRSLANQVESSESRLSPGGTGGILLNMSTHKRLYFVFSYPVHFGEYFY